MRPGAEACPPARFGPFAPRHHRAIMPLESRAGARTDAEVESLVQTQELLAQYDGILDTLRAEYEEGWAEGINLPSDDDLTRGILVETA